MHKRDVYTYFIGKMMVFAFNITSIAHGFTKILCEHEGTCVALICPISEDIYVYTGVGQNNWNTTIFSTLS